MQIRQIRVDSIVANKEYLENIALIRTYEKSFDDILSKDSEVNKTIKRQELEYECLEEAHLQVPKILMKLFEEFEKLSEKKVHSFTNNTKSAQANDFWIGQNREVALEVDNLKNTLKHSKDYHVQSQKAAEARLSTQLQEEELNLAYCNSCIEALRQKNREMWEQRAASYTQSRTPQLNMGSQRMTFTQDHEVHRDFDGSSKYHDPTTAVPPLPPTAAANHGGLRGGNPTHAAPVHFPSYSAGGGSITHTMKRTVTEVRAIVVCYHHHKL
jgi:hypothetical protein